MIASFHPGPFPHGRGLGPVTSDILPRRDQIWGSPLPSALASLTSRKDSKVRGLDAEIANVFFGGKGEECVKYYIRPYFSSDVATKFARRQAALV